jgi:hypothetical protein
MLTGHRRLFMLGAALLLAGIAEARATNAYPPADHIADWTVMVFMNGKGDLKCQSLSDFADLARARTTPTTNIVVQLGLGESPCSNIPNSDKWTGVLNFWIRQGVAPIVDDACHEQDCPRTLDDLDMGDPKTLKGFVLWSRTHFRAKHFMLVLSAHGYGSVLRQFFLNNQLAARAKYLPQAERASDAGIDPEPEGGYSFISSDRSFLYVRDVSKVLTQAFPQRGLDLLAFDSCLMGSIESAYELRNTARLIIADEDRESIQGWDYSDLANYLSSDGALKSGQQLAMRIAARYSDRDSNWPLSIIATERLDAVAASLSDLGRDLRKSCKQPTCAKALNAIRGSVRVFGAENSVLDKVDIRSFATQLAAKEDVPKGIQDEVRLVTRALDGTLLPSVPESGGFSPSLSVYFPASKSDYCAQRIYDQGGYALADCGEAPEPGPFFALQFVEKHGWSLFLMDYLSNDDPQHMPTFVGSFRGTH